jgi:hypothetical protein
MVEDVEQATAYLIHVLSGQAVSGRAYHAAKELFSELLMPTIRDASNAIARIEQGVERYTIATDGAGEELLDEDNLNHQLRILRFQATVLQQQIDAYDRLSAEHAANNMSSVHNMYLDFQVTNKNYLQTIEDDIRKINEKLQRLHAFNDAVAGIFTEAIAEMDQIRQALVFFEVVQFSKDVPALAVNQALVAAFEKEFGQKLPKKLLDGMTWLKKVVAKGLKEASKQALKEGKNLGTVWAGALMSSSFQVLQLAGQPLSNMSNGLSTGLGYVAKGAGLALTAWGAWETFHEFNDKYHNSGRAFVYSGVVTTLGIGASAVGTAVGTGIASAFGAGLVLGFFVPIAGAVVLGVGLSVLIASAYEHVPWFRDTVDVLGDGVNNVTNTIQQAASDVGAAFTGSLQVVQGAFGW